MIITTPPRRGPDRDIGLAKKAAKAVVHGMTAGTGHATGSGATGVGLLVPRTER